MEGRHAGEERKQRGEKDRGAQGSVTRRENGRAAGGFHGVYGDIAPGGRLDDGCFTQQIAWPGSFASSVNTALQPDEGGPPTFSASPAFRASPVIGARHSPAFAGMQQFG